MGKYSVKNILMMVITLIFVGALLPYGLVYLLNMNDVNVALGGTTTNLTSTTGGTAATSLIIALVPVAIAIGLVLYFVNNAISKSSN